MRRLTVVVVIACLTASAQEPLAITPQALLVQSHALAANLPVYNRASLIGYLLRDPLARTLPESQEWADEAFQLSMRVPEEKRARIQSPAISRIARVDPDHALSLLNAMEVGPSDIDRSSAAAEVFQSMLVKYGDAALPVLLDSAKKMMSGGTYPYLAMVSLLPRSTPAQRDSIFSTVAQAYENSRPSYRGDAEFVRSLNAIVSRISARAAKAEAPRIAVRLQQFAESDPQCPAELRFYNDQNVTVLDCGDMDIWDALPALRRMDPKIARALIAKRPPLQQPGIFFEQRAGNPMRMAKHDPTVQADQRQDDFDTTSITQVIANQDPAAAIDRAATAHTNAGKLNATILVALQTADRDPVGAKQIISDAVSKIDAIGDTRWQMTLWGNVAQTAEKLQDFTLAEQCIANAFALAPKYIADSSAVDVDRRIIRAYNGYGLWLATRTGARVAQQSTLERIRGIQDDEARAYLLIIFARGLGSRPVRPFDQKN